MSLASFSEEKAWKGSPASGTSCKPVITTGVEGTALLTLFLNSLVILLTLQKQFPTTKQSPTWRVPFWTNKVAFAPSFLSMADSITEPLANFEGFAFNSFNSATKRMFSNRSSIPIFFLAEIGFMMVSPPHSSGTKPKEDNSDITFSGLAPGLSILLMATIIGTLAARAWSIASLV